MIAPPCVLHSVLDQAGVTALYVLNCITIAQLNDTPLSPDLICSHHYYCLAEVVHVAAIAGLSCACVTVGPACTRKLSGGECLPRRSRSEGATSLRLRDGA